jgi:hypothetical protein
MKDLLKRGSIWIVCILALSYLAYLFEWQQIIVQSYFVDRNTLYFAILAIAFVYIFIFFALTPFYFKISKVSLFVLWLSLIVLWDTVLVNDINKQIYLSDITKVLWVFITLLAFTNFFVTNKVKKQQQESKIEIIEI